MGAPRKGSSKGKAAPKGGGSQKGSGRPSEGKEDWKPASYRLPPGLRDAVKAAFHRAAGQPGKVRLSFAVNMDTPHSINEFVAAILIAATDSI